MHLKESKMADRRGACKPRWKSSLFLSRWLSHLIGSALGFDCVCVYMFTACLTHLRAFGFLYQRCSHLLKGPLGNRNAVFILCVIKASNLLLVYETKEHFLTINPKRVEKPMQTVSSLSSFLLPFLPSPPSFPSSFFFPTFFPSPPDYVIPLNSPTGERMLCLELEKCNVVRICLI